MQLFRRPYVKHILKLRSQVLRALDTVEDDMEAYKGRGGRGLHFFFGPVSMAMGQNLQSSVLGVMITFLWGLKSMDLQVVSLTNRQSSFLLVRRGWMPKMFGFCLSLWLDFYGIAMDTRLQLVS